MFEGRWSELPSIVKATLLEHAGGDRPVFRELPDEVQTTLLDCGLCNVYGRWLPDAPFFEWMLVYRRMLENALKREGERA